ncbi:uncharacterized protein LOC129807584 [Phlebotomus papatasi]|uniref:Uncharacterized protein n=1 Tax=Phlebotomus papatasi TaxID=29031 RepID=A0A1B0DH29_PHLPP|nr:uncharacterized protein LOC129807584 [Phlebotomus papatasi]
MAQCGFCGKSVEESFAPNLKIKSLLQCFNKKYNGGSLCRKCYLMATSRLKIEDIKKGKENQYKDAESGPQNTSKRHADNTPDSHEERGDSLETHRCSQAPNILSQPSLELLRTISIPAPLESQRNSNIYSSSEEASSNNTHQSLEICTPSEEHELLRRKRRRNEDEGEVAVAVEIANDVISENRQTVELIHLEDISDNASQDRNLEVEALPQNINSKGTISMISPLPKYRRSRESDLHMLRRDLINRNIPNANELSRSSGG